MNTPELVPPHNIEAEQAVLGSILIDPHALYVVADSLKPVHFYRSSHQVIYTAMLELMRLGGTVDIVTICDHLDMQGKTEAAGGSDYVTMLVNAVPTSTNIETYQRIVYNLARGRAMIKLGSDLVAAGYSSNIDPALDLAMKRLIALSAGGDASPNRARSYGDILLETRADIEARSRGEITGLRTGFGEIDNWTGGFEAGQFILLAGRPGSGKSACGLAIARRVAGRCQLTGKGSVLVITMEMSASSQARRLIGSRSDPPISTRAMRLGFREDDDVIDTQARQFTRNWQHEMDEAGRTLWFADGTYTTEQIYLHALRAKHERDLSLVVIDQLDLTADDAGRQTETERIGKISKSLKLMARRLEVPVLCLAQLNREVEKRADHRPEIADLRQSGRLEQDADIVMALYRPACYAPPDDNDPEWYAEWAELLALKCRDDQSNMMMPLRFIATAASYTDWPFSDTAGEEAYIEQRERGENTPKKGRSA